MIGGEKMEIFAVWNIVMNVMIVGLSAMYVSEKAKENKERRSRQ